MESFSEVPINIVIDRINKGRAVLTELSELYRHKAEYEEQCAASLLRISKRSTHESEISGSSSERALGNMKNYLLFSGREHEAFSRALKDQLPHILEDIVSHQNDRSMVHKQRLQDCMRSVGQDLDQLEQVRQQSIKSRNDLAHVQKKMRDLQPQTSSSSLPTSSSSSDNLATNSDTSSDTPPGGKNNMSSLLRSFGFPSLSDKPSSSSSSRNVFSSSSSVSLGTSSTNSSQDSTSSDIRALQDRLMYVEEQNNRRENDRSRHKSKVVAALGNRDDTIKQASYFYHDLECSRLNALKWSLQQFIRLEKIHLDARRSHLDRLDTIVQEMDPLDDVHMFVSSNRNMEATFMYAHALSILEWAKRSSEPDGALDETDEGVRREYIGCKRKLKKFVFGKLIDELEVDLTDDDIVDDDNDWNESSFQPQVNRLIFLQILNKQRVEAEVGTINQFHRLVRCMKLFLDSCLSENDFKSGLGMLTMINTFYYCSRSGEATDDDVTVKVYAQDDLKTHGLWLATSQFESDGRRTGFWEYALLISIKDQARYIVSGRSANIDWDDLDHDALREEIGKVHYSVYMQISNLVCHMKNVGLTDKYIISFVLDMSQRTQLPETYLETIFKSMRTTPEAISEVIRERKASYVMVENNRRKTSSFHEEKEEIKASVPVSTEIAVKEDGKIVEGDQAKEKGEVKDFDLI